MTHYSQEHERILTLVLEQRWLAFASGDEDLLKSFVYTGHIYTHSVKGHPGRYRLTLSQRGALYLASLRQETRMVDLIPAATSSIRARRASDVDGGELHL